MPACDGYGNKRGKEAENSAKIKIKLSPCLNNQYVWRVEI
jgi:hypothetical protein